MFKDTEYKSEVDGYEVSDTTFKQARTAADRAGVSKIDTISIVARDHSDLVPTMVVFKGKRDSDGTPMSSAFIFGKS